MFVEFTLDGEAGEKYLCNMGNVNGIKKWGANTTMIIFGPNDTIKVLGSYEEIKKVIVGGQENG